MHVPRPLFELRHFVFVLSISYNAFNSDMNDKRGVQTISIALFVFLKDFAEVNFDYLTTNHGVSNSRHINNYADYANG